MPRRPLAKVLAYVGADIVEAAFLRMPMTREAVGPDGVVAAVDVRSRVATVLQELSSPPEAPAAAGT